MSGRQQKNARMKISAVGKQTTHNSIQVDQSLDQSGIYEAGMAVSSVGKDSVHKMQFMPQKIGTKTNIIHAVGIKAAANTVGGKPQQHNPNSIIV